MRLALQKLLALVLAAGLLIGGPAYAHAQVEPCHSTASYGANETTNYADLRIDPADDASLQSEGPAGIPHHDDGLCKTCCTTCIGANLPATTLVLMTLAAVGQMTPALDDTLAARAVPTEPGIPRPL